MKKYLFKAANSERDDFVVDAQDEGQALERARAVARYQNVSLSEPVSPREVLMDDPVTVSHFKDGYFIVNRARLKME